MSDEKRATLKKVLLGVMSLGALQRTPLHAATPHTTTVGGKAEAPATAPHLLDTRAPQQVFDNFHNVFNNADPYVQTFGDLFVLEEPFFESSCW